MHFMEPFLKKKKVTTMSDQISMSKNTFKVKKGLIMPVILCFLFSFLEFDIIIFMQVLFDSFVSLTIMSFGITFTL